MSSRPPSPQPSTSGYPLEVIVNEESPGPSGEEAGVRRGLRGSTSKEEKEQKSGRSS